MNLNEEVLWPGWKLGRLLGKGSFGAVYEIERDVFGKTEKAALKLISIPQSDSDVEELLSDGYNHEGITQRYDSYLKDIVREYSLMAELKGNSNIVDCDDLKYAAHKDGYGWDISIKMELLTPLTKALGDVITEQQAIQLGIDICKALVICKRQNVVHRDIKPQNIFVSKHGLYKLGDFGIAKVADHATTGTKTGTFKYMAPEVYNNQPYGTAADIYSLGLVLYWMLNERRTPFLPLPPQVPTAFVEEEAKQRRFRGDPIPPPQHGCDALKEIVLKACAYDPEKRYSDPQEMLNDLTRLNASAGQASFEAQPLPAEAVPAAAQAEYPPRAVPAQPQASGPAQPQVSAPAQPQVSAPAQPPRSFAPVQPKPQSAVPAKPTVASRPASAPGKNVPNPRPSSGSAGQSGQVFTLPTTPAPAAAKAKNPAGRRKWLLLGIAAVVLAIAGLLAATLLKGEEPAQKPAYPSERVMAGDAAKLLRDNGVTGGVTDLNVLKLEENEKYKTCTASCEVSVSTGASSQTYQVLLIYELNDDGWSISDLSRLE